MAGIILAGIVVLSTAGAASAAPTPTPTVTATPSPSPAPTQSTQQPWWCAFTSVACTAGDLLSTPPKCEAPTPQKPSDVLPGWLNAPNPIPAQGSPFGPHPTTTYFQQYGLAGLSMPTCAIDKLGGTTNPEAVTGNMLLNGWLWIDKLVAAAGFTLQQNAQNPAWLNVFDQTLIALIHNIVSGLSVKIFFVTTSLLGLVIIWQAGHTAWGKVLGCLVAVVAFAAVISYVGINPLGLVHFGDAAATTVVSQTSNVVAGIGTSKTPGDAATMTTAHIVDTTIVPQICGALVGSDGTAAAANYCPKLLEASAYTWSEEAQANADPKAAATIAKSKKDLWNKTVSQMQSDPDPTVYESLRGVSVGPRAVRAFNVWLGVGATAIFQILLGLGVLILFVIVRALVVMVPVILPFAVFEETRHLALKPAKVFGWSLASIAVLTIGGAFHALIVGTILSDAANVPWLVKGILVNVITIIFLFALAPFMAVWRPLKGRGPGISVKKLTKLAGQIGLAVVAGGAAGAAAGAVGGTGAAAGGGSPDPAVPDDDDTGADDPGQPLPPIVGTVRPRHAKPAPLELEAPADIVAGEVVSGETPAITDGIDYNEMWQETGATSWTSTDADSGIYSAFGGDLDDAVHRAAQRRAEPQAERTWSQMGADGSWSSVAEDDVPTRLPVAEEAHIPAQRVMDDSLVLDDEDL
jgi:hypothetical protein